VAPGVKAVEDRKGQPRHRLGDDLDAVIAAANEPRSTPSMSRPARRTVRPHEVVAFVGRDPSHRRDAKYGPAVDHLMIRSPPLTADPVLRDWIGIHAGRCCRSLELRGPPGRGHLAAVDANGRHWGDSVIPYGISSGRKLRVDGRIPRAPVGRPRAHL
jgi:hypothetical protein